MLKKRPLTISFKTATAAGQTKFIQLNNSERHYGGQYWASIH